MNANAANNLFLAYTRYIIKQNLPKQYHTTCEFEWTVNTRTNQAEYLEVWLPNRRRRDTPRTVQPDEDGKKIIAQIFAVLSNDAVCTG